MSACVSSKGPVNPLFSEQIRSSNDCDSRVSKKMHPVEKEGQISRKIRLWRPLTEPTGTKNCRCREAVFHVEQFPGLLQEPRCSTWNNSSSPVS